MSEYCVREETRPLAVIPRHGICDRFYVGLAVLALVRVGEALAADPASAAGSGSGRLQASDVPSSSAVSASGFTIPENYAIPGVPETKSVSSRDFRPHATSMFNSEHILNVTDESLMSDTPVWHSLSDYSTLGRVRVLTLWQSSANSISLQAGKKGTPSLQWTAHLFTRSTGSPRVAGLLDRLFPVSVAGESNSARGVVHALTALPPVKGATATSPAHPAPAAPP